MDRRSRLIYWGFNTLIELLSDAQVEGRENFPEAGPYIVATNHIGVIDVPFAYVVFRGENVTGWAAEKYQSHPFFGPLVRFGGGTFIERGQVDRGAMQFAIDSLKGGKIFGLSPEGTRSPDGTLQRGKTGVAYLAEMAKVPILPCVILGTNTALGTLLRFRRPQMLFRIGKLFHLPPLDEADRTGSLRRNTDEIMCRIAVMLPVENRGFYADHPRLQELLAEGEQKIGSESNHISS